MNFRLVVRDQDVLKGATHLVELHGRKAVDIALRRSAQLIAGGSHDGAQVWLKTADVARRMLQGPLELEPAVQEIDDEIDDDEIDDDEIDGAAASEVGSADHGAVVLASTMILA
jgi:hypothetical protein